MKEDEALSMMVSPRMTRKGIWRGGVLQLVLTRSCDLACTGCTQHSQLAGSAWFMTPEQAEVALNSVKNSPWVIGLFGGNCVLSKHFEEICRIMQRLIPFEQRGLWSNRPFGKTAIIRETFNPQHSNINVHQSEVAYKEWYEGWPEIRPYLKGLRDDSRHGPPDVAMRELDVLPTVDHKSTVENTEEHRWDLIANCDINRHWSSAITVFRGELRAFFCELAAAQAVIFQDDPSYPDTGLRVDQLYDGKQWWELGMNAFAEQAKKHCHDCGIPLRGFGDLAVGGVREQISPMYKDVFKLKRAGSRNIEVVTRLEQLGENHLPRSTDYIQNSSLPVIQ